MKKIGVFIVSHYNLKSVEFQIDWHRQLVCPNTDVKTYLNNKDYDQYKEYKIKDGEESKIIIGMNIQGLYNHLARFYAMIPTEFEYEYYFLLEPDAFAIKKCFDAKIVEYMKAQRIDALFPTLVGKREKKGSTSILGFIAITKEALDYYRHNFRINVWHEQDLPQTLERGEFRVATNPFVDCNVFKYLDEGKSLKATDIMRYKDTTIAIHPIKENNYSMLNDLKEKLF